MRERRVDNGPSRDSERTILDFGEQWTAFPDNRGYYASTALLADFFEPLIELKELRGSKVGDIGSGTGRIVRMLLDCGVQHVVAVEPSRAADVLERNLSDARDRVTVKRSTGEGISEFSGLELVFAVGVLHHIPDPLPVVRAAYEALADGGKLAVWLYAREGNELYLKIVEPLRAVTTRLPHFVLIAFSWLTYPLLAAYLHACRFLPLPMKSYMTGLLGRLDRSERVLTIYDQLNPRWSKYYTRSEAEELLREGGFVDVRSRHRHGYSWTVVGTKPARDSPAH